MDNERYRVVLTGDLVSGFSREAVIAAVARLFETSAGKLVGILDGRESVVDAVLDADEAAALQQRLEDIGAQARIERISDHSHNLGELHLPHHDDPGAAGLMRCPACGHQQLVARKCDECGIVFAEYNRQREAGGPPPGIPPAPRPGPQRPRATVNTTQNIHTRANDSWQDAWVDEGDELPTEQYHVNLYMGRTGTHLAETCQRMMLGPRTHLALSWAGGAVISPFLWAMYRKMWAWGAVIFVTEILLPVLLIALGSQQYISDKLIYVGVAGIVANRLFWPLILKYLYCRHARGMIAYMNRMSPTYASDIDIATAGGSSKTSVFVGIVLAIVVSLLAWNIVDTVYTSIMGARPAFDDPPATSDWSPTPSGEPETPALQNQAISNENKWVATRSKLRTLGQQINAWLGNGGSQVDPARLGMADIGEALLLDFNSTLDGWGKQIQFRFQGDGYLLLSAGPDGEYDTADDVTYRRSIKR